MTTLILNSANRPTSFTIKLVYLKFVEIAKRLTLISEKI